MWNKRKRQISEKYKTENKLRKQNKEKEKEKCSKKKWEVEEERRWGEKRQDLK